MSRLQAVQMMVQQVAEAMASVLKLDVSIVDETMLRIAGTGSHEERIGKVMHVENSVYRKVLDQGLEYIITDVRTSNHCSGCSKYADCRELAQICCPIKLDNETIGVIGLVAFTTEQKQEIEERQLQLLEFIRKMAELIAAKVIEKNTMDRLVVMKNQMETVLNFVAEGIIAVDVAGRIITINFAAEKLLKIESHKALGSYINDVFPGTSIKEVLRDGIGFIDREVKVWYEGRQYHYIISARPILEKSMILGVVASFRAHHIWQQPGANREMKITFNDIIGSSSALKQVKAKAEKAAQSDVTVLLTGESGTGKELFARAIHAASNRCMGPFIAVNSAAIPENLLESELFGYEEGAFSGAKKGGKPGKFQLANGGTLFLDEIGDMPLVLQAKLLRVLQDKMVERVGGLMLYPVNVRIIAATHRNLETMVKNGSFREDLYYRLDVFDIVLPPLRKRKCDILKMAHYFLHKHGAPNRSKTITIAPAAERMLLGYEWPGNIRELENVIESAVAQTDNTVITAEELPDKIKITADIPDTVEINTEQVKIRQALEKFGRNMDGKRQAAASLGMGIATLYRKMQKYGMV